MKKSNQLLAWKNLLFVFMFCLLCFSVSNSFSQNGGDGRMFGLWQNRGLIINKFNYPELQGRIFSYKWKDLETSPGVWNWQDFDNYIFDRVNDSLPVIFRVFTQENAPDWLFELGVPKVIEKDYLGNLTGGYAPYYPDSLYKYYFKRMISKVRQHIEAYPYNVRKCIIGVHACFGEEGDYIGYKGKVDRQYWLSDNQLNDLFQEFSLYYYNEYKDTNPRIRLFSNPSNNGEEQTKWLLANCPNGWLKFTRLGKVFQVNNEIDKKNWLLDVLNKKQNGEFVRAGTELSEFNLNAGWWKKNTPRNMFTLMSYMIYWGMDWSQQLPETIMSTVYEPAFNFFNKYAGQKDTSTSVNGMCAFRDGLDAADISRFPESVFGAASIDNETRFKKIADQFSGYGAKLDDVKAAMGTETANLYAKGVNDVGWRILPGNYERYIYQLDANETSTGYWNVDAPADPNSIYGKYARGISTANGKDALYFNIDKSFLNAAYIEKDLPVSIDITYLDKGTGSFGVYYDSKDGRTNKEATIIKCRNSGIWKKASVVIDDPYFGNRGSHNSDFYVKSLSLEDVIFSVIEFFKSGKDLNKPGFTATSLNAFDTLCYTPASISTPQSFMLNGAFLDGSVVKIGPAPGFRFAEVNNDSAFQDSILIKGYGSAFQETVYVIFKPPYAGDFNVIPVQGGGSQQLNIPVNASAISSSPDLSANISDITCNNDKNGAIDLILQGGEGPFSYQWSCSEKTFKVDTRNIDSLIPGDYTVIVTSKAGCIASKTFSVKQPDILEANVKADSLILCKGATTTVHVSASGGTAPYTGTGTFVVDQGYKAYQVVDKNGCSRGTSIYVENGTKTIPLKPAFINGANADATGICGSNEFTYSVSTVDDATSYKWSVPDNAAITSYENNGEKIKLTVSPGFSNGIITASARNVCGTSNEISKYITMEPDKPGSITGPSNVSQQQRQVVYEVQPVIAGVTYEWEVTNGAVITSGQHTSKITVDWDNSSGKVKVLAKNDCGLSPYFIYDVYMTSSFASGTQHAGNSVSATDDAATATETAKSASTSESSNAIQSRPGILLQLRPNPAKDYAYLTINGSGKYFIELCDITGKVLLKKATGFISGYNQEHLNLQSYATGIYLIHVTTTDGYRKTIKLLKE